MWGIKGGDAVSFRLQAGVELLGWTLLGLAQWFGSYGAEKTGPSDPKASLSSSHIL